MRGAATPQLLSQSIVRLTPWNFDYLRLLESELGKFERRDLVLQFFACVCGLNLERHFCQLDCCEIHSTMYQSAFLQNKKIVNLFYKMTMQPGQESVLSFCLNIRERERVRDVRESKVLMCAASDLSILRLSKLPAIVEMSSLSPGGLEFPLNLWGDTATQRGNGSGQHMLPGHGFNGSSGWSFQSSGPSMAILHIFVTALLNISEYNE